MEKSKKRIKEFIEDRDWEQFHSPKNLTMALSVEVAEIAEIFQWKTGSEELSEKELISLEEELGDVMIYLIELSNKYDINLLEAAEKKLIKNDKKYPADLVRGKTNKYIDYQ